MMVLVPGKRGHLSEDVTSGRRVLAAGQSGTELTCTMIIVKDEMDSLTRRHLKIKQILLITVCNGTLRN
jgi:hypothetical protein